MIDSVAGAVVAPSPAPSRIIWPTISTYGVEADANDTQKNPADIDASPPATTRLVPIRSHQLR